MQRHGALGLTRYPSAADFLRAMQPKLEAREDEYNLILGVALSRAAAEDAGFEQPPALFAHTGSAVAPDTILMMTPPFPLVIIHSGGNLDPVVGAVAEELATDELPTRGVLATPEVADAFAAAWGVLTERAVRSTVAERLHRVDAVEPVAVRDGRLVVAGPEHFEILVDWVQAFTTEAVPDQAPTDQAREVGLRIEMGDFFLWVEGDAPVGMAARTRKTTNAICISSVYTPPEHRNKGVGLSCVTRLTQQLLQENRFCLLYTDLSNPTSNALYRRIGYRPVCDYSLHWFD